MPPIKQYKLLSCTVDHASGCPCSLEEQINDWAAQGYELVEITIKGHNGATCWLAIMVKNA